MDESKTPATQPEIGDAFPKRNPNSRVCLAVTKHGVKVYANRDAFRQLAEWMLRLAASPEREYYECHVTWHLEPDESFFGRQEKRVWVLYDDEARKLYESADSSDKGFELDFMTLEAEDLDNLQRYKDTAALPDDWGKE